MRTLARGKRTAAACSLLAALVGSTCQAATYALIVSGLGGESEYEQRFRAQAAAIADAAEQLAGDKARVTRLSADKANRESVRKALRRLAGEAGRNDRVMIVLIGHGSFDGEEYRFNVPGPDVTATELAVLLNQITAGEQLIVNATSASGAVIEPWRRAGRIIISATKNGGERTATRFAQFWLEAVGSPIADVNKDETVTAMEAFEFAARQVAESFKTDVALATEHPRLEGGDAARFQVARLGAAAVSGADSALSAMLEQRAGIESDLEVVRQRRGTLPVETYYDELEAVLVRLALLQKQIDERQAQSTDTSTSMIGGGSAH